MQSTIFKVLIPIFAGLLLSVCFVAGLPWYFFVGFAFVIAVTLLFMQYPKKFLIYLLLFRAAIDPVLFNVRFSVAGVDLGLGGSLSLLLIAGAIFTMMGTGRGKALPQPISAMWILFCLINVVAFFYSFDRGDAAKALIRYFSIFSIFILSYLLTETEEDGIAIVRAVLFSGVFTILGGLIYFCIKKPVDGRFAATLGHPNILAFYLLILLAALFSVSRTSIKKWVRCMLYILFLAAMVFSKTRSGWLAAVIMAFFYSLFFNWKLILPGGIGVAALVATPFVRKHIDNAVVFTSYGMQVNPNGSLGWRLEKWSYLWKAFLQAPFSGHGIDAAVKYGKDALGAHNDYLKFLVETGVFGLILAFLPYFYILFKGIGDLRQENHTLRKDIARFIVIFMPSFLVMSFSDNLAAYIVILWYLWAILGVYFALCSKKFSGSGLNQ